MKEAILNLCIHIAEPRRIVGAFICGEYALGICDSKIPLEVIIIINDFQPKFMSYIRFLENRTVLLNAIDRRIFEKDVKEAFLGDAMSVQLAFPYIPLIGGEYLEATEIKLKERFIRELLENLVLNFPELSHEIYIKPEYFAAEALLSRARLFPLMLYSVALFFRKDRKNKNFERVMNGYLKALENLERGSVIFRVKCYVKIAPKFIENVKSSKTRLLNFFKSTQRALFLTLLGVPSRFFKAVSQNWDILFKLQASNSGEPTFDVEDSNAYLFLPTDNGVIPLANTLDLKAFARKTLSVKADANIRIEKIGGVLNDVYLVKAVQGMEEKKAVAKSFREWTGFKWFPLSLWALGTKNFALRGSSRLERECAINRFLYSRGISVPRLLGVNLGARLIFMEYLEGETLEKLVKRIIDDKSPENQLGKEFESISKVGVAMARIHELGVTLGDTKPENMLLSRDGQVYFLDLEQASRGGDKSWDIAEFLYYSGHYASSLREVERVRLLAETFIKGYLSAVGEIDVVKAAGKPKYTRVFSLFTLPIVIAAISKVCREADRLVVKDGST